MFLLAVKLLSMSFLYLLKMFSVRCYIFYIIDMDNSINYKMINREV